MELAAYRRGTEQTALDSVRITVTQGVLLAIDAERLAGLIAQAAGDRLGIPADAVTVLAIDPEADGYTLVCANRQARPGGGSTNLVTVLHHLAEGRGPRREPPDARVS